MIPERKKESAGWKVECSSENGNCPSTHYFRTLAGARSYADNHSHDCEVVDL